MTWDLILPYALPPVLGAVIGYVTNSIAVRMLFRPLRPWMIGRFRLPFTPGVIPRRRDQLARSIGRMVSRELLTADVFERRFADPVFAASLQRGLVGVLDALGSRRVDEIVATVRPVELVDQLLRAIERALDRDRATPGVIASQIDRLIVTHREVLTQTLTDAVAAARPFTQLGDETIEDAVDAVAPLVADALQAVLSRPEVREDIEARARRIIRFTLDQLNDVQRLFVGVGQYDRRLMQRVPEIVDRSVAELVSTFRSPEKMVPIATFAVGWVHSHREATVGSLLPTEAIQRIVSSMLSSDHLASELLALAPDADLAGWAARARTALVARLDAYIREHGDRPISAIAPFISKRRASIARRLVGPAQSALTAVTAQFVSQLDVEGVVVARVEELDIERVEGLLLGIIRDHLRWINVFGALLGAIIGASQILLRVVGL